MKLDAYFRIDIVVDAKEPSNRLAQPYPTHRIDSLIDKLQGLIGAQQMERMILDNLLLDKRKNLLKDILLRQI